jgi:hypothetical protein
VELENIRRQKVMMEFLKLIALVFPVFVLICSFYANAELDLSSIVLVT